MTFFQKIINWFKAKFFKTESGEELTEIIVDAETEEIKEVSIYLYSNISGYDIFNVKLYFNDYMVKLVQMGNTPYLANKITLTSEMVDFSKLNVINVTLDLISDTGEEIHIDNVKLGFDETYIDFGKLYYKITAKGLGLIPITFNATVEDYIIQPIEIENKKQ